MPLSGVTIGLVEVDQLGRLNALQPIRNRLTDFVW